MISLFSAQRIPLMAFASLFVFAGVATVMNIPGNLTADVMSTCGDGRLEAGEDCERGVESFVNPCVENEQCNATTCLCPSHGNSSAYFSSSSVLCPLAATLYCPAGRIISGTSVIGINGCPTHPTWCCGNGTCEGEESMRGCTEDCTTSRSASSLACIGEGQKGAVIPDAPQCCSGLNRISIASESGDLCANAMGAFLCTKSVCGDGVCGKDENRCNCSNDCPKAFPTPVCGNNLCERGEDLPCPPCMTDSTKCTCSTCPRDCENSSFRRAYWQCYNGSESNEGGPTSCKDRNIWEGYAKEACAKKCSADSMKCGVNSFKVWEECGSSFVSSSFSCIGKGEQGSFTEGNPEKCCEGLRPIKHVKPDSSNNNVCIGAGDMSFICAPCGNGFCDANLRENSCNCPADCRTQSQKCAEEGKKVYGGSQFGPTSCCSKNAGIKPDARIADNGLCVAPSDGSFGTCVENWWRTCGDGVCGKGEDRCNCRKDCGQQNSSIASAFCGDGRLDAGEECERGVMCPIPACAEGAICPGYTCNDSTCRCEWESVPASSIQPTTTTVSVLVPVTDASPATVEPAAGFEDVVLTAPVAPVNPFSDTDLSTPEGRAAADLYARGIIGGYPDGEFKGSRPVNRAEAAKFLLLARFGNTIPEPTGGKTFPDVLDGQWYVKYVLTAAEQGIISGYPDGLFRPANTVNTAEFLKMMALTFDLPQNLPFTYSDVPSDSWFAPYAGLAEFYHLFPQRTAQLLPQKELTRQDVVIAINRYLNDQ